LKNTKNSRFFNHTGTSIPEKPSPIEGEGKPARGG